MSAGRIFTGDELTHDVDRSCDVCVIGSGAGGSAVAEFLCAQGKDVVLLEEGGYHTRREFDLNEARAYTHLYQEFANRATNDHSITILQGRSVGGGTTVNWTSCFRTPRRILDHWRDVHGIVGLTEETLTPHWEFFERRLNIQKWPLEQINRNNRLLWDGLGALGYHRDLIPRNVHRCANLGYCGLGCPIDAKQGALVTLIPDAVEKGLTVYADTAAVELKLQERSVIEVRGQVLDRLRKPSGKKVIIRPKKVAVAGGAINSPALLLRSGLTSHGRVGRRTFLHPVMVSAALFAEPVEGFYGAPQSVYSKEFIDRGPDKHGFFIEVPPIHPMLASSLGGFGQPLHELMARLSYVQAMIGITVDGLLPGDEGGTIGLRDGGRRLDIQYPLKEHNREAFRAALREQARLQFAAGALEVYTPNTQPRVLRSLKDLGVIDSAPMEPTTMKVVTAHQMGGCAMGPREETSVVDPHFRFWGLDNLYVTDGSVLPTSLGVNPQLTIYGLARLAAQKLSAAL